MSKNSNVIYMYTIYGVHAYLGKGITKQRAYDLKGHKHCIPSGCPLDAIDVHIIADDLTTKQASLIEAEMIRDQGLLGVWNNINGLTPEKARKLAQEVLNRPVAENGFMTVPKELVKSITNQIEVKGDVLLAADKNAKIHTEIQGLTDTLTIVDGDIGSRSLHGEVLGNLSMISDSFLTHDFGDTKYNLIIMNPPWVKVGTDFIDKAVDLLKPDGRLVCIMSYNQFTSKSDGKKGTFYDLQQRGSFHRIETYKGNSDYGTRKGHFHARGDWLWFIWDKNNTNKPVTIVNRLGEEFSYKLHKDEYFVPQLHNEREYFNWVDGATVSRPSKGAAKNGWSFGVNNSGIDVTKVSGNLAKTRAFITDEYGNPQSFMELQGLRWRSLYESSKQSGGFRFPPVKKELLKRQVIW